MCNRFPVDDDESLKGRLQREARLTRPAFSQTIHERLCRSVRRSPVAAAPRRRFPSRFESLPARLAAALLIGASLAFGVVWHAGRISPPDVSPQGGRGPSDVATALRQASPDPSGLEELAGFTDGAVSRLDVLVDSTLSRRHWAYLDEDARSALIMLADRVPVDVRFLIGLPDSPDESPADLARSQ